MITLKTGKAIIIIPNSTSSNEEDTISKQLQNMLILMVLHVQIGFRLLCIWSIYLIKNLPMKMLYHYHLKSKIVPIKLELYDTFSLKKVKYRLNIDFYIPVKSEIL